MSAQPWLSLDDWQPPNSRYLGNDFAMERDLRAWSLGRPLTSGLPHVWTIGREDDGHLRIDYDDGRRHGGSHGSWMVSVRQAVTHREAFVAGYGSLTSALEDCLEIARAYEAEDAVFMLLPGLA